MLKHSAMLKKKGSRNLNTLVFTSRSGYLQNGEKRQINPCLHRKNKDDRPDLIQRFS